MVLRFTGQNQRKDDSKSIGFWYSLDMLLPFIQLRQAHYACQVAADCLQAPLQIAEASSFG
jgi:hypothetical protein